MIELNLNNGIELTKAQMNANWTTIKTAIDALQANSQPSGTVTSVGLALPSIFTVSNSPVIGAGTLTATFNSQTAGYIFAAPTSISGQPTFRALATTDLPVVPIAKGGTNLTSIISDGYVLSSRSGSYVGRYLNAGNNLLNIITEDDKYTFYVQEGNLTLNNIGGVLGVTKGGTGVTSASNGQLLIGNATNGFTLATLTAGSGISITNGNGSITIAASFPTPVPIASGGTNTTSQTNNGVTYFDGTKITSDGSLTYSSSKLTATNDMLVNTITVGRGLANLADNTAFGYQALSSTTTGSGNSGFGYQGLKKITTGLNNTAIGSYAGSNLTTGSRNVAVGSLSISSTNIGDDNIGIGYSSCWLGLGNKNIGIGTETLVNATTGSNNIVIGYRAGYNLASGSNNVILGGVTLSSSTTLSDTMIFGTGSGTERFRVNSNGCLGVNITSPTGWLSLPSNTASIPVIALSNSNTLLSSVTPHTIEFDGSRLYSTKSTAIREALVGCIYTQTATATVGGTLTETSMIGTGVGTITIPANTLVAGKTLKIFACGYYSTYSSANNMTLRFKIGGTTVLNTGSIAPANSIVQKYWESYIIVTCTAANTVWAEGLFTTLDATTPYHFSMVNTTTTTVDTTTLPQLLGLTMQWGGNNAANTITTTNLTVEILN